jgi:DNA-binding transcriptional MerR regulator
MKDWLSIGQFSKRSGVSARALRIYEEVGLLQSHARGENGYRYYRAEQLSIVMRIKHFKNLGFSLAEVKSLLFADSSMDFEVLKTFLNRRLEFVAEQERELFGQKIQIQSILSSLDQTNKVLGPSERRFIMSHFEKISIVVTGIKNLEQTAQHIKSHLARAGQAAEVLMWQPGARIPDRRPYVLVIHENFLKEDEVKGLMPDVVVIKDISVFNPAIEESYANLYTAVGPHMTTVFNADDRVSVELAANRTIRRGKIYYYSKNSGLAEQIERIGGVISDGEELKVFGFNQTRETMNFKFKKLRGFDEEVAVLAAVAAVLDIGMSREEFAVS